MTEMETIPQAITAQGSHRDRPARPVWASRPPPPPPPHTHACADGPWRDGRVPLLHCDSKSPPREQEPRVHNIQRMHRRVSLRSSSWTPRAPSLCRPISASILTWASVLSLVYRVRTLQTDLEPTQVIQDEPVPRPLT